MGTRGLTDISGLGIQSGFLRRFSPCYFSLLQLRGPRGLYGSGASTVQCSAVQCVCERERVGESKIERGGEKEREQGRGRERGRERERKRERKRKREEESERER